MQTLTATRRNAIEERGTWAGNERRLIVETVERLTASTIADYEHQSGPRGLTTSNEWDADIALREALANLEAVMLAIANTVRQNMQNTWIDRHFS